MNRAERRRRGERSVPRPRPGTASSFQATIRDFDNDIMEEMVRRTGRLPVHTGPSKFAVAQCDTPILREVVIWAAEKRGIENAAQIMADDE